jgi:transposase InsO family protein
VKYAFIEKHRKTWPIELLCGVLQVARSGFYAWRQGPVSGREGWRERVVLAMRRIELDHHRRYGSPRMHRELLAQGHVCCENTVARLMKAHGIKAKTHRRYRVHTTDSNHDHPIAPNRLERLFRQDQPDKAWVGDITYVPTREGWLYVAVVLDLFSRRVVGWSTGATLEATLAIQALKMAVAQRRPEAGLVVHTDRGVQYACRAYREVLKGHGLVASMSRRGDCYDNAVAESFNKTLKSELVMDCDYATREAGTSSLFAFLELYYNRQRRHSTLGYQSPEAFEARHSCA